MLQLLVLASVIHAERERQIRERFHEGIAMPAGMRETPVSPRAVRHPGRLAVLDRLSLGAWRPTQG